MRIRRFVALMSLSVCVATGCQKAEPPSRSPQPATTSAAAPPAPVTPPVPPEPPQTSMGKLVKLEKASKTKVRIQYLTTSGLKSGVEQRKPAKGQMFVELHFEGEPEGTTELVFHDGDQHAWPIKPEVAPAPAAGKTP